MSDRRRHAGHGLTAGTLLALLVLGGSAATAQASAGATLTPGAQRVELDPGTSTTVDYALDLPAQPRHVDVFFLMDSSTSMERTIDGLADSLPDVAARLQSADVDVQFGLAEFQDAGGHEGEPGIRYRRRQDVAPLSRNLARQLASIVTHSPANEPHLTAMDQMTTGAGIAHPSIGVGVSPGQQATWRAGAIRLAVMFTDEPYGRDADPQDANETDVNTGDPDGPDEATALRRLRDSGVLVVGVRIVHPDEDPADDPLAGVDAVAANRANQRVAAATLEDLRRWAGATGGVAPPGGTDCDADGAADLPAGDPLVCTIREDDSGAANDLRGPLVGLVLAQRNVGTVGLQVDDPHATVTAHGDYSGVDLTTDQHLAFTATFACGDGDGGLETTLTLRATVAGTPVAEVPVTLHCTSPPDPAAPEPAPAAAPPPPPPPPAPVTVQAPAPASAPAPAAAPAPAPAPAAAAAGSPAGAPGGASAVAPAPAPGGAVVDGGSAEARVRLAHADRARRDQLLLAVPTNRQRESLPLLTWGGALALTLAAGVRLRRRRRPALATARRRG